MTEAINSFPSACYREKIVILDRDGTINEDSDDYIKSKDEWQPIPGSLEAIAALSQSGFKIYIATNQSGLARGYYSLDTLNDMHQKMTQLLTKLNGEIHGIFVCPHHPDDRCHCRKPNTGLIEQIAQMTQKDLSGVLFIGDSSADIEVAQKYGLTPALVLTGKGERTLKKMNQPNLLCFNSLYHCIKAFLPKAAALTQ
jgi:D-glycero-D-manno-heptose 1,7-bisphosphate phosphatase